jgi:hypothetical protein
MSNDIDYVAAKSLNRELISQNSSHARPAALTVSQKEA